MRKILYAILAILCVLALIWLTAGSARSRPWAIALAIGAVAAILGSMFIHPRPRTSAAYQQLLRKAHGDVELVERLIAYERGRLPEADRRTLEQRALERWERDLR